VCGFSRTTHWKSPQVAGIDRGRPAGRVASGCFHISYASGHSATMPAAAITYGAALRGTKPATAITTSAATTSQVRSGPRTPWRTTPLAKPKTSRAKLSAPVRRMGMTLDGRGAPGERVDAGEVRRCPQLCKDPPGRFQL
jgi:hypothetical protein